MIALALLLGLQCPDGSPPPCRAPARGTATPQTSVAVLYFDNSSRDTADAYLADGITEEIISRLGEVGRLQVKSRHLVRRYRGAAAADPSGIGRQLAVASIVTGSVRRAGNRVRVTAEMVRTSTGDVVWSERYDRATEDVLSLQADLAGAVATAITGRLLPAEARAVAAPPTRSREAWDFFVRGNYQLAQRNPQSHGRALAAYEAALRLDPGFQRAQARTALAYALAAWRSELINDLWPDSSLKLGRVMAERAVRADPGSSDARLALGVVQLQWPESLATARVTLARAIALDSASAEAVHVSAWVPAYQNRLEEASATFHRALALEPNRPVTLAMLAAVAARQGHVDDALRFLDSSLALDRTFYDGLVYRSNLRIYAGDTAGARADLTSLALVTGSASFDTLAQSYAALHAGDSSRLRAWTREELASVRASARVSNMRLIRLANALLYLGDAGQAMDALELSRWPINQWYFNLQVAPLDRLRGQARYERILNAWHVAAGVPR